MCMASPIAWVPVAQADTKPKLGPRAPTWIATNPQHIFPINDGIVKGETLRTASGNRSSQFTEAKRTVSHIFFDRQVSHSGWASARHRAKRQFKEIRDASLQLLGDFMLHRAAWQGDYDRSINRLFH